MDRGDVQCVEIGSMEMRREDKFGSLRDRFPRKDKEVRDVEERLRTCIW